MRAAFLLAAAALGVIPGCGASHAKSSAAPVPRGPSCEAAYQAYVASTAFAGPGDASEVPAEAYAEVLNYGSYFVHCPVEDDVEISICAAVQHGQARGVTVTTSPRRPETEVCIDQAVRRLHFPTHAKMDLARTFFGKAGSPPWGEPRDDPATQTRVSQFLKSVSSEEESAALLCAPTLVAMPELWTKLVAADPSLEKRGVRTDFEVQLGEGRRSLTMQVLDSEPDIQALLESQGLREIARRLSLGRVRPAAAAEREAIYKQQLVAFTPNTPVTVAEGDQAVLAVLLSEGKVYWMELLADRPAVAPAVSGAPAPEIQPAPPAIKGKDW